jgi:hypothetical protein
MFCLVFIHYSKMGNVIGITLGQRETDNINQRITLSKQTLRLTDCVTGFGDVKIIDGGICICCW